jgi:cell wall-associated NlpC family hydrolase
MAAANDIAFFSDDNGKIVHTGILCDANRIIHASGWVRIDRFDQQGIFSNIENKYTHKLHSIKRL